MREDKDIEGGTDNNETDYIEWGTKTRQEVSK